MVLVTHESVYPWKDTEQNSEQWLEQWLLVDVVSEFIKFDPNDIKQQIIKTDIEISGNIIKNESFKDTVIKDLSEKYHFDMQKIWELVEEWVSIIDWNRQESVISRFRVSVQKVLLKNGFDKENAKNESEYISDKIIKIATELSERSEK